jgi:hypothetical protein
LCNLNSVDCIPCHESVGDSSTDGLVIDFLSLSVLRLSEGCV